MLAARILDEEARRSDRRHDPARPPRKVTVARETMALLIAHRWPGNIRELQNVLRFALIKCKGVVLQISAASAVRALEQAGGHPGGAARTLGVSRATLYRHLPKDTK